MAAHAQSVPAQLAYPASGAQSVELQTTLRWSPAANARGYRVQISSQGPPTRAVPVKDDGDVFDSGEQTATMVRTPSLPAGRWLFVRLWTHWSATGEWDYGDSSFQTVAGPQPRITAATFTYPQNAVMNVDTRRPFTWTAVTDAEGYYLKIGTSPGAQNLFNGGALPARITAQAVPPLPTGQTLYARLWTKANNVWVLFSDITFQALPRPATFINPRNGSLYIDTRQPFSWTAPTGAQGFRVQIGTAIGARNLLDSGELSVATTSCPVPALPNSTPLFARLWTKAAGAWTLYTDSTFQAFARPATFLYPTDDAQNVTSATSFSWTSVAAAQGYYLQIGTEAAAHDLLNTGELPTRTTSRAVSHLPLGRTLYARLWTKQSNVWLLHTDIRFKTQAVSFTAPLHGDTNVASTTTFRWTPAPTVAGKIATYTLGVGTAPGWTNVVNKSGLLTNSYSALLGASRKLYARVKATLGDGSELYDDIAFSTIGASLPSLILSSPPETQLQAAASRGTSATVDASAPFAWNNVDAALAYRLQIYAQDADATPLRDSGVIHVPRVFFSDLPLGSYTGRIGIQLVNGWQWRTFPFTVIHSGINTSYQIQSALWATNFVRAMATSSNYPYRWTILYTHALNWPRVTCLDYRETLLRLLQEMGISAQFAADKRPRRLNIAFSTYDVHALAEMYNTSDGRWVLLDPTFAIVARRIDGRYASKDDIQKATRSQRWSDITYTPLGSFGTTLARDYYLDYPLLYLNLTPPAAGAGEPVLPYLQSVAMPVNNVAIYTVQSLTSPVTLVVNGRQSTFACLAADHISALFGARTINSPVPADAQLLRPRRFVFTGVW